jgi:hypothetical protein
VIAVAAAVRLLGLLIGLAALGLQVSLTIPQALENGRSLPEALVFFFSYFTILTNILAVFCYAALLSRGESGVLRFFRDPRVVSGVLVYIIIVGLIYFTILRHTWTPEGLWKIADESLHYVAPVFFALHWLFFLRKGETGAWQLLLWQIFPLAYLAYVMTRGALTGTYPYPFIDAAALGYPTAIRNIAMMIGFFVLMSALVITLDKLFARARLKVA